MSDTAYADAPDMQDRQGMNEPARLPKGKPTKRLKQFAAADGDISDMLDADELTSLGMKVTEDWNRDKSSNTKWRQLTENALKRAAQDNGDIKTFPWANASRVQYPILTVAGQQFAARAYPAIVKGDEAVDIKVIGDTPKPPPQPQQGQPPDPQAMQAQQAFQQVMAQRQAKQARATRVKTWMNYHLFYGMDDWEASVDVLLNQLPIIGMAFKKVYFDPHRGVCSDYVNALHLTVPCDTQSLDRCPRVTQDYELYPYEIHARQASGVFRETDLIQQTDDEQAPRCILEQHRLHDLDDDGIEEPYIITVDEQSNEVLRIEAAFTEQDIAYSKESGQVVHIKRWMPFIAFPFMPDPEGKFYGLGFGQLLAPLNEVINTTINQLMDAGTAAAAGGGFIGSGLRLQGAGQTTTLRWQPGEWKFVTGSGQDIRNAIFERTLPEVSPVLFKLLDLMLGAAKEIASIKDVLTGEAPSTAPVGTTMALIEQGLQSFSALYKRVYRSMKAEYKAIYECEGRWGSAQEYMQIVDDPMADFKADFSPKGDDIVPVSDPSVVTRAQALAKAQVIQQAAVAFPSAVNPHTAVLRLFEAADIDNPEALIVQPPAQPPPNVIAELQKTASETDKNTAQAEHYRAQAAVETGQAQLEGAHAAAFTLGSAHQGGVPGLAGQPGQPMGVPSPPNGGGNPAGGMAPGIVGQGGPQPAPPNGVASPS